MNLILLGDFALMKDLTLIPKVAKEVAPLGIGHHGNRTDERFRSLSLNYDNLWVLERVGALNP